GDHEVDATHSLRAIINRRTQGDAVAHIRLQPSPACAQVLGEGAQTIGLKADEGHTSPSGGGKTCHLLPDSPCGSGDYQLSTRQVATHEMTSSGLVPALSGGGCDG